MIQRALQTTFAFLFLFCLSLSAQNTNQCDQQSQAENNRHLGVNNELKKQEDATEAQYQKEVTACQEKYSGNPEVLETCTAEAGKRERIALLEISKKRVDEDTLHENRSDEIAYHCSTETEKDTDPCQNQADTENNRHREKIFQLKIERNEIQGDYKKDVINCQEKAVSNPNPDQLRACTSAAGKNEIAAFQAEDKKQEAEDTAHNSTMTRELTECLQCTKGMLNSPDLMNRFPRMDDRQIYLNALQRSFTKCAGTEAPIALLCSLAAKRAKLALEALNAARYGCVIDGAAAGVVLHQVWTDLNRPVLGVSPEDAGERDGEYLCRYGMLKILDDVIKTPKGEPEGGGAPKEEPTCNAFRGLSAKDQEVLTRALELASGDKPLDATLEGYAKTATGATGDYLRDLTALWQAVGDVFPGRDVGVYDIGKVNGVTVWGSSRTRVGLVQMNGTTMIVQMVQTASGENQLGQIIGSFR